MGDRGFVCPKVNLGDIFFVTRPSENQSFRNKVDRKHVDFLVCHPQTMKPLFGVELDDKSHSRSDRVERDVFVEKVFDAAGLPLVRKAARDGWATSPMPWRLNLPRILAVERLPRRHGLLTCHHRFARSSACRWSNE